MKKIPIPSMINWMWNMGFIISMLMIIQTTTGFMMAMNYINPDNSFNNNMKIFFNNNWGWLMRIMHMNLPSFIFITIIMHMTRNIYFNSFKNLMMWNSGFLMLIIMMMTSFLGYTLPWSQMSYWGMMVITNLISLIPMIGFSLMTFMWGNFNINETTINRMFILHFLLPLLILMLSVIHINILHKNFSFNQLGISNKIDMISFKSYFMIKDIVMLTLMIFLLMNIMLMSPMTMNNPDNFIMMNYIITPNQIEPEWYFMMFYSILRLINNKLGGLTLSMLSMLMIYLMPMMMKKKFQSNKFYPMNKILLMTMMMTMYLISMMGFKKMDEPYMNINKMLISTLFMLMPIMMSMNKIADKFM